jgi:tape measure domain-containing protein
MADSARFLLVLKDMLSGPAKQSTESLKKLEKQLGLTRDKLGRLRQSNGRFATDAQKAQLGISGTGEKTKGLIDLITKADVKMVAMAGAVLTLGAAYATTNRVIKTDSLRAALDVLTHGRGAASFAQISDLAVKFGLDIDDTAKSYANFLKLQFTPEQGKNMLKLGADMQALGATAEDVQGIFLTLGQIKSKGKLQAEELLQLAERGVSGKLIKEHIARLMGVAESEVEKLQQGGKVSSDIGLQAIEAALNQKLGQKQAGESGQRFAENQLAGILNVWKSRGTRMFIGLADKASGGLSSGLKKAGQVLGDFGKSEQGAKTIKFLEQAFKGFGEIVEKVLPLLVEVSTEFASFFAQGFNDEALGTEQLGSWVDFIRKDVIPLVRLFGYILGRGVAAVQMFSANVAYVFQAISGGFEFLEHLVTRAFEIGTSIGGSLLGGLKAALGIASPSKEMERMGIFSGRGFEKGLERSMPSDIGPSVGSSNQVASTAARIGSRSASAGGGVSTGPITIQVNGAGNPEAVAAATMAAFEANLGRVMSRMQLEAGA